MSCLGTLRRRLSRSLSRVRGRGDRLPVLWSSKRGTDADATMRVRKHATSRLASLGSGAGSVAARGARKLRLRLPLLVIGAFSTPGFGLERESLTNAAIRPAPERLYPAIGPLILPGSVLPGSVLPKPPRPKPRPRAPLPPSRPPDLVEEGSLALVLPQTPMRIEEPSAEPQTSPADEEPDSLATSPESVDPPAQTVPAPVITSSLPTPATESILLVVSKSVGSRTDLDGQPIDINVDEPGLTEKVKRTLDATGIKPVYVGEPDAPLSKRLADLEDGSIKAFCLFVGSALKDDELAAVLPPGMLKFKLLQIPMPSPKPTEPER